MTRDEADALFQTLGFTTGRVGRTGLHASVSGLSFFVRAERRITTGVYSPCEWVISVRDEQPGTFVMFKRGSVINDDYAPHVEFIINYVRGWEDT